MKNLIYIVSILFFFECSNKETFSISGTVTDVLSGMPIENVYAKLESHSTHYLYHADYEDSAITGKDGRYNLTITGSYINIAGFSLTHGNYTRASGTVEDSDIKRNYQLYPIDSYIKIKVFNTLNFADTILVNYITKNYQFDYEPGNGFNNTIPKGGSFEYVGRTTGDNMVYIKWKYLFPDYTSCCGKKDSVYVSRGDTATIIVNM